MGTRYPKIALYQEFIFEKYFSHLKKTAAKMMEALFMILLIQVVHVEPFPSPAEEAPPNTDCHKDPLCIIATIISKQRLDEDPVVLSKKPAQSDSHRLKRGPNGPVTMKKEETSNERMMRNQP